MAAPCARAGREADAVRLVAVTKYAGVEEARALVDLGLRDLGENRLAGVREKIEALQGSGVRWHMIGNVQRRKAREVVALFDTVDAVDRPALGEALQRHCEARGKRMDVLAEINVSGEASKHGAPLDEAEALLDALRPFDLLRVQGLLCMAPRGAGEAELRGVFRRMRALAEAHGLAELSMGMSNDFEIAIEEGATQVRIGQALFQ